MNWNHFLSSGVVIFSMAGLFPIVKAEGATNETKGTKLDQQQTRDNRTTKSKLEGPIKDGGVPAFRTGQVSAYKV